MEYYEVLVTSAGVYLKGNRYYWLAEGAPDLPERAIEVLSDRWIKPAPSAQRSFSGWAESLSPATAAHCMSARLGTLRKLGVAQMGLPAEEISDAGDVPGDAPGVLYVAVAGPPVPLRLIQTGPETPGGRFDPLCDSKGGSDVSASDVTYSDYNRPVSIDPPSAALDFSHDAPADKPA